MTKYRARYDDTQWIVEEFEPGGEIAKRGRTAGQKKAARWKLIGYQPNIKHVCRSLMNLQLIGDELPDGIAENASDVLEAFERIEARIFAAVENMPNPKTLVID